MKVSFGQIYVEPGVAFPFSFLFQRRLSDEVTALIAPSTAFTKQYGDGWRLMFRVSAKRSICDNEIRGPSVFKKSKDVEFTIFLPFDTIQGGTIRCTVCGCFPALGSVRSPWLARFRHVSDTGAAVEFDREPFLGPCDVQIK